MSLTESASICNKERLEDTVPALTFVATSIKIISVIPVPEYLFDKECGFPNPIIY